MPALIISTTPVKPERIPEPLWVEIIFPTLNNLKILNQAELILSPNAIDINSGTTETISIKPFMLKTYDNLLFNYELKESEYNQLLEEYNKCIEKDINEYLDSLNEE